MQMLVIASTKTEIEPFIASHLAVDVLITGVGVPSTIYRLQKQIQLKPYDLIIQAGIAGSFNPSFELGKPILVKQDCFADLGFEEKENFIPIFKTTLEDENKFPFEKGWLINSGELLFNSELALVSGITINKLSDSRLQKSQLVDQFNADIETMEGAALHYVCLQENISFLQLRSISNYVAERDKNKWEMDKAIANLNKELIALIEKIIKTN